MNIISLNILFVDDDKKFVLTESPYLFVNDDLKLIINEIRRMVKEDFPEVAKEIGVSVTTLNMGMTTFSNDKMHFFEVDIKNIRELKDVLLKR